MKVQFGPRIHVRFMINEACAVYQPLESELHKDKKIEYAQRRKLLGFRHS
jgi:hypothetical protein